MRRIAAVTVILSAVIAVSLAGVVPNRLVTRAAPEQVYIAVGDSIAAGQVTSLPRKRGYPALVRDLIERQGSSDGVVPVTLMNLARPGETAASFLAEGQIDDLRREIDETRARGAALRALTLSLGGNEMLALQPSAREDREAGLDAFRSSYPAALDAVLDALGEDRPPIVVTTYYDLSEGDPAIEGSDAWWVAQFNAVIRDTAGQRGVSVAEIEPVFRGRIRELTWSPVDIHPNNHGHEIYARLVWDALGLDTQAPEIILERPEGTSITRRTPTIRVKASDDTGVDQVMLLIDGVEITELRFIEAEDAWLGVWDGRARAGETVSLAVRVRDLAGNETLVERTIDVPAN